MISQFEAGALEAKIEATDAREERCDGILHSNPSERVAVTGLYTTSMWVGSVNIYLQFCKPHHCEVRFRKMLISR